MFVKDRGNVAGAQVFFGFLRTVSSRGAFGASTGRSRIRFGGRRQDPASEDLEPLRGSFAPAIGVSLPWRVVTESKAPTKNAYEPRSTCSAQSDLPFDPSASIDIFAGQTDQRTSARRQRWRCVNEWRDPQETDEMKRDKGRPENADSLQPDILVSVESQGGNIRPRRP